MPPSRSAEDRTGRRGCKEVWISARCHRVFLGAFLKHAFDDRNDGPFKRHLGQLGRAARSLGEIIADAERNSPQRPIAVRKGKAASRDQVAESGGCHSLQQSILIWVMEIKSCPVQGGFIRDLLDGDVVELFAIQ